MSVQHLINQAFLGCIAGWLESYGWEKTPEGNWNVPQDIFDRPLWKARMGGGRTYRMEDAIKFQVSYVAFQESEEGRNAPKDEAVPS